MPCARGLWDLKNACGTLSHVTTAVPWHPRRTGAQRSGTKATLVQACSKDTTLAAQASVGLTKPLPDKLLILHFVEVRVETVARKQFFVPALLLDLAVIHDNDLVGLLNG